MRIWCLSFIVLFLSMNARADIPPVQSGDIVFQSSTSKQSSAIIWATKSVYSHTGIVEVVGNKKYVIETLATVKRTPLDKWIARGRLGRYAIYRYEGITPAQQQTVVTSAKKYNGRSYDIFFTSKNKELYCSELVYLAYKDAKIPVGTFEKVKDLDVDNFIVQKLIAKRWRSHPLCKKGVKTLEACWNLILNDDLISPEKVSKDIKLKQVWTNYPI